MEFWISSLLAQFGVGSTDPTFFAWQILNLIPSTTGLKIMELIASIYDGKDVVGADYGVGPNFEVITIRGSKNLDKRLENR